MLRYEVGKGGICSTTQARLFELPEPKITALEHQAAIKQCPCGHLNTAMFPSNIMHLYNMGKAMSLLLRTKFFN